MNFRQYLAEDLLAKGDRNSMAEGLEIRCPFLDKALVEYAASLPGRMHFDWFQGKKLLRRACGDLVPQAVLQRKKMGFGIPLRREKTSKKKESSFRFLDYRGQRKARMMPDNLQARFLLDQLEVFFEGKY